MALSPLQLRAIHLILLGHSNSHIAKKLAISRMTLYRWQTFHARFIAELGRQRKAAFAAAHQRLRSLLQRSLSVLSTGLQSDKWDTRFRAAHAILSHCGPRSAAPDPNEPDHPNDILDPLAQDFRRQIAGNALDGLPLNHVDRQQAIDYLAQNLAAPALPFDPEEPAP